MRFTGACSPWPTVFPASSLAAADNRGEAMEGEAAVGRRVCVFWEGESEWFKGVVTAVSPESGYFVRYDDGEEQWEAAGDALEFVPSPSDDAVAGEPAMPSPSYSQQEFEDDGGNDRDDDQEGSGGEVDDDQRAQGERCEPRSSSASSHTTDLQSSPRISSDVIGDAGRHEQRKKTARALMGGGAPFFRDQDALREMERALEMEKCELAHAKAVLETQLVDRERESAAVRRELEQLKTQISLASALHYTSSHPSQSSMPTTSVEWKQRVFDLKLDNQQLQHDIVELKTASQAQQRRVGEQQQRVEQLRAKVARVLRRELLTLVDLQVEIALPTSRQSGARDSPGRRMIRMTTVRIARRSRSSSRGLSCRSRRARRTRARGRPGWSASAPGCSPCASAWRVYERSCCRSTTRTASAAAMARACCCAVCSCVSTPTGTQSWTEQQHMKPSRSCSDAQLTQRPSPRQLQAVMTGSSSLLASSSTRIDVSPVGWRTNSELRDWEGESNSSTSNRNEHQS